MTFYMWNQNNSGGGFDVDECVSHRVVIEADSYEQAEAKAFDFGIYYDGVDKGIDCGCCGNRWYGAEELDKNREELDEYLQDLANEYGWTDPDIIVHYADGSKKTVNSQRVKKYNGK